MIDRDAQLLSRDAVDIHSGPSFKLAAEVRALGLDVTACAAAHATSASTNSAATAHDVPISIIEPSSLVMTASLA